MTCLKSRLSIRFSFGGKWQVITVLTYKTFFTQGHLDRKNSLNQFSIFNKCDFGSFRVLFYFKFYKKLQSFKSTFIGPIGNGPKQG